MRGNNVLGIVYSNIHDESLSDLTNSRTMGSVPFGGRYRLIDFPLSNMVNCGISKVGVITKSNYRSLMDHLGTGKPWDLSRKREGMVILPPFNNASSGMYRGRIEALKGIMGFIHNSKEELVVLSDSNMICNLDLQDMFNFHEDSGADITIAYKHGNIPHNLKNVMAFNMDEDSHINEIALDLKFDGEFNFSLNVIIMRKLLLERLVNDANSHNWDNFERDIVQRNVEKLKIFGYQVNTFAVSIDSTQSYYDATMSLLKAENRKMLFSPERPIYTKVRDDMPTRYGLGSSVKNSLVADGCIIEGEVEGCILFRGVRIGKGASVKNSIIMQGSYISDNASLNCVIMDKSVVVKPKMSLSGAPVYPIYIGKGITI